MIQWRPSSPPETAQRRADMLARARQHFDEQQVLGVDTPALSAFATSDPNIESFAVRGQARRYLHTSPESGMKCLLAAGYPDIYSICRVFRDSESGPRHLPEFTLLEWYRLGFHLPEIVADTVSLIASCLDRNDLRARVDRINYAQAFVAHAEVDVFSANCDDLANAIDADRTLRRTLGEDRNAWLDLVLVDKVVPAFAPDRLTVLQHYPAAQAALARVCPSDARVADRFEVFYGTLELANGYVELTDEREQRRRFEQDLIERAGSGQEETAIDTLLLAALKHGLPQCAGVAVGFERLQMIFEQTNNIADVVTFAHRNGDG